ncbi:MAG: mechanosensitive ion channel [Chitinophagaceae bacterium]|nr:mechanosensitive ion channel [Chitinophagaceae bacterium]
MNDLLERIWLGNSIRSYLIVAVVIFFVLVFKRYISRYFAGLLFQLVNRIWKNLDRSSFVSLVVKPLGMFLLILVSIVALHKLRFPEELNGELYGYSINSILHSTGTIILIVSFIRLLLRIITFISLILERKADQTPDQTDNQLVVFFRDFFKVVIAIIGVLMVLKFAFGFDISSVLTGLSIVGAAIALALRESLENLIASFIIFFDKPFTLGDLVKVQNITGNVEKIGLRSTRIRTDNKTYVTVPNKQMVDSILDNLTLRTQLKGELRLQIGLSASSSQLQNLVSRIRKILEHEKIESATVSLNDIAVNAFLVNADYFTSPMTHREYLAVKEEVNLQVLKLMEEMKIEIAGASTDIRIDGAINAK